MVQYLVPVPVAFARTVQLVEWSVASPRLWPDQAAAKEFCEERKMRRCLVVPVDHQRQALG